MEENRDLNEEIIDETEGTAESAEEVTEEVNEAENNEENDLAIVKKLKEKYKGKVYFNFVPEGGITKYIIKAELEVKNKDELLQIQNDIRYDEIRRGIIYRRWSKSS